MIAKEAVEAGEIVDAAVKRIAPSGIRWVKCPVCQEDWNRLTNCRVWMNTENGMRPFDTSACGMCATTVWRLEKIASMWPLAVGNQAISFEKQKMDQLWSYIVKASDSLIFQLWGNGGRIVMRGTGITPDMPMKHDSAIAAWFWLKERFERGETLEVEKEKTKDWGKPKVTFELFKKKS